MTSITQQLASSQSASMIKEKLFFEKKYTLVLPNGVRLTASGRRDFCFEDNQGEPVLDIKYIHPVFDQPHMEVRFENFPTLKLRMKDMFSRSVLILNESGERVLRVQKQMFVTSTCKYKILDVNDVEVGRINKSWQEYDVHFPHNLDVKYKAALMASCIFVDKL